MNEKAHKGRPYGEKMPPVGAKDMSDEEFWGNVWSTIEEPQRGGVKQGTVRLHRNRR